MKITLDLLNNKCIYPECIKLIKEKNLIGLEEVDVINKLIEDDILGCANTLIVKILNKIDCVKYAVYAAEQVIDIYEKKYPNGKCPRKSIEAAKFYINNPNIDDNDYTSIIDAAYNAYTAYTDTCSTNAVRYTDINAAYAAYAAADSAFAIRTPINAIYAAINAAVSANDSEILKKIIKNGIEIIKGEKNDN
jgi:hypothetical protein